MKFVQAIFGDDWRTSLWGYAGAVGNVFVNYTVPTDGSVNWKVLGVSAFFAVMGRIAGDAKKITG